MSRVKKVFYKCMINIIIQSPRRWRRRGRRRDRTRASIYY